MAMRGPDDRLPDGLAMTWKLGHVSAATVAGEATVRYPWPPGLPYGTVLGDGICEHEHGTSTSTQEHDASSARALLEHCTSPISTSTMSRKPRTDRPWIRYVRWASSGLQYRTGVPVVQTPNSYPRTRTACFIQFYLVLYCVYWVLVLNFQYAVSGSDLAVCIGVMPRDNVLPITTS